MPNTRPPRPRPNPPTRQKTNRDLIALMSPEDRQRTARSLCRQPWRKERDFQKLAEGLLDLYQIPYLHLNSEAARYLSPGWPDLIVCVAGRWVGFELKASKGWVSQAQKSRFADIEKNGGEVHVVRSMADLKAVLDAIMALPKPNLLTQAISL